MIMANDQREHRLYYSVEQSSEKQNFEIPEKSECIHSKEI